MTSDDALRFPIGDLVPVTTLTPAERVACIADLAALPERLRAAVAGLTDEQLDTPYRPGGWTVRQVVHHLPDSHMNGFIRTKLALTEPEPTIKPYDEKLWADLPDTRLPIEMSVGLVDGLQARWAVTFRAMTPDLFGRTFVHPELGGAVTLDRQLHGYAWHSRHHVAHITALRQRQGW
jgi:hypothetical protein